MEALKQEQKAYNEEFIINIEEKTKNQAVVMKVYQEVSDASEQTVIISHHGDVLINLEIGIDSDPVHVKLTQYDHEIDECIMTESGKIPFDILKSRMDVGRGGYISVEDGGLPLISIPFYTVRLWVTGKIKYINAEYVLLPLEERKIMATTPQARAYNTIHGRKSFVHREGSIFYD